MSSSSQRNQGRRNSRPILDAQNGPIRWSGHAPGPPSRPKRVLSWIVRNFGSALWHFPWRFATALSTVPLILLAALAIAVRTVNQDVVYPRVRVAGAPIGGLTVPEARVAVAQSTARLLEDSITLRSGDQTWRRSLLSLGIGSDDATVSSAVEEAWKIGHRTTWQGWWSDMVILTRSGAAFPPRYSLDRDRARAALEVIVPSIERDPTDAEIVLVQAGDGYEVHLTPATTGLRVDITATIDAIAASIRADVPVVVDIATRVTQPSVTTEALRTATAAASALVDDPIELVDPQDPRRRVVLDPPTAHAMLELGRSRGGVVATARLDPAALRVWVADVGKTVARAATNPRIAVDRGTLIVIPGIAGRHLDVEATALAIEAKLADGGRVTDMVVLSDLPWVPTLAVEEARAQVETAVREPLVVVVSADGATKQIRVQTESLLSWLALPDSQSIPRDTSQMAPSDRPRLTWGIDSDAFGEYVRREVLPLVAADATPPRVAVIARPDPFAGLGNGPSGTQTPSSGASTAIALATTIAGPTSTPTVAATATQVLIGAPTVRPTATTLGDPPSSATPTSVAAVPFRLEAVVLPGNPGRTVNVDGLRRAVDARLHADLSPLAGVLVVPPTATPTAASSMVAGTGTASRSVTTTSIASMTSTVTRTRTATSSPTALTGSSALGTPTPVASSEARFAATLLPTATQVRSVTVEVVEKVDGGDPAALAAMARTANVLIGAPIIAEWSNREWRVEPNDLVDVLRFGPVGGSVDAYLGRDGLFALVERIGREAVTMVDAPRDAAGAVLPVDVPRTAAAIWAAANRTGGERRAEIAWIEDEPTPIPGVTTPRTGPPTATRTPIRNPAQRDATPTPTATARP